MPNPISVLIVEDNKAFANSLKETIEAVPDMHWMATYHRGEDCMSQMKSDPRLRPDVILLDLHLPGRDGLNFIPLFKQMTPQSKIIILTQDDTHTHTLEAIKLGVSGYLLKNISISEIWTIIREVHQGGCIIDSRLSRIVLDALTSPSAPAENPLSEREQQVLEQLAMGYLKKEIADNLELSQHTINRYTENLYKKLQVSNVAAAVASAIRKGII
ncbi:MAG: response regulator transcription factor [Verrucomicrobiota bacterium]